MKASSLTLSAAVLLAGMAGYLESAALAAPIQVNAGVTTIAWDLWGSDGVGDAYWSTGWISAGELDDSNTAAQYNRLERALIEFNLPAIAADQKITSVVLRLTIAEVRKTGGNLNASLYNSQTNIPAIENKDNYGNPLFTDTGLIAASTNNKKDDVVNLDVTSYVLADYANDPAGGKISQFRIQIDGQTFVDDSLGTRYCWYDDDRGAQLIITTEPVPEAVSAALLLPGVGMLISLRKRRPENV